MSSVLIVGGDKIDGIKQVLSNHGVDQINHWSGRKVGDSHKIIPQSTRLVVLITDLISHSFTHKIKYAAAKRGLKLIYTTNGPAQFQTKFEYIANSLEDACRETLHSYLFLGLIFLITWYVIAQNMTYSSFVEINTPALNKARLNDQVAMISVTNNDKQGKEINRLVNINNRVKAFTELHSKIRADSQSIWDGYSLYALHQTLEEI